MRDFEPTLESIEDYNGKESREKKLTVRLVILSGLLVGAIYGWLQSNAAVSDELTVKTELPRMTLR